MPKQLHHVIMRSHSAPRLITFLTGVVGMEVQFSLRVPGEVLEKTSVVQAQDLPEQLGGGAPVLRLSALQAAERRDA